MLRIELLLIDTGSPASLTVFWRGPVDGSLPEGPSRLCQEEVPVWQEHAPAASAGADQGARGTVSDPGPYPGIKQMRPPTQFRLSAFVLLYRATSAQSPGKRCLHFQWFFSKSISLHDQLLWHVTSASVVMGAQNKTGESTDDLTWQSLRKSVLHMLSA